MNAELQASCQCTHVAKTQASPTIHACGNLIRCPAMVIGCSPGPTGSLAACMVSHKLTSTAVSAGSAPTLPTGEKMGTGSGGPADAVRNRFILGRCLSPFFHITPSEETIMAHSLPTLPYAANSLEPFIDTMTMEIH